MPGPMMKTMRITAMAAAVGFGFQAAARAEGPPQLDKTIQDVQQRWPDIPHVGQDEAVQAASQGSAVIFDVRSPEEYAVSHVDGATQVDPAIPADQFLAKYAATLKGKTAIFYCSVGVRSSKLASRVAQNLKEAGAAGVASLKGGIFSWAHAGRPLVDTSGPTAKVHGYDESWGRLLPAPATAR